MNKKLIIGGIVGLLSLSAIYFINQSENHKPKYTYEPDHELNALNDYGPQKGPLYVETEPVKVKVIEGKEIYHKPKKIEEKKDIVMIDGIPYERYKGYLMPPEPDPEENKKTLLGVDVNNNYVRDDLERYYVQKAKNPYKLGIYLQEARTHTMLMIKKENLAPAGDLYLKLYLTLPGEGKRDGISNKVANTKERKLALRGPGSGGYEIFPSNYFMQYAYNDFTYNGERGVYKGTKINNVYTPDFSGYEWDKNMYKNKPFPIYDEYGHLYSFYYNGKTNDIKDKKKVCKLNYGINDTKECDVLVKNRISEFKTKKFFNLKKEGYIKEIYENVQRRLSEGSWNE